MNEGRLDLELLAKRAVDGGALPRRRVHEFTGRYGAPLDTRCPVCRRVMLDDEMTAVVPAAVLGFLTLHVSCFHAWQMVVAIEAPKPLDEIGAIQSA